MLSHVLSRGSLAAALAGVALLAVVPTASAAEKCSGWGPGGHAVSSLKVCASVADGKVIGKGYTKTDSNGAIVWIQAVNVSTGKKYGTRMGKTLSVKVPSGRYQVDFYRGDGKGVITSPTVKV
ncbi:hypothetical protein [Allokutzneria oryzae]|uniref:Carboxypeptidase regulatory-like domain-containing protein n=1 Tax=Allokutzneria oryzae TaxID=1378989 RepID=A0ABV5ZUN7_9PSEU